MKMPLLLAGDCIFDAFHAGQRGANAQLDTDNAFHTYRIQITSPTGAGVGNQLSVYYDNSASPIISGVLSQDFNLTGTFRRVAFGDGTQGDSGTSQWQYLWHNGSAVAVGVVPEPTALSLLGVGFGMAWFGRRRHGVEWT